VCWKIRREATPRHYVSGEALCYLGRQYRLKVLEGPVRRVVLSRGYITVSLPNPANKYGVQDFLRRWYMRQAKRVLSQLLAECYPRVAHLGIAYPV
jgi:predicted metal-dependent hydrolase